MRVIRIEWNDSASISGWVDGNTMSPSKIITVGILANDTPEYTSIYQSGSSTGNFAGLLSIPKGCIVEVEVIGSVSIPDIEPD